MVVGIVTLFGDDFLGTNLGSLDTETFNRIFFCFFGKYYQLKKLINIFWFLSPV
jgi:hypothetical protein